MAAFFVVTFLLDQDLKADQDTAFAPERLVVISSELVISVGHPG